MRKQSQGFGIVEIIIGIAAIALVGTLAWMFVNNQNSSNSATKSTDSSEEKSSDVKAANGSTDEIADERSAKWLEWHPTNRPYSIRLADGWRVYTKGDSETSFYTVGGLELKPGTLATVVWNNPVEAAPCDGLTFDYMDYTYPSKWYTGKETMLKTNKGLEIKKSIELPGEPSNDAPFANKNTNYSYVLSGTNESVMISYTKCEKSTDLHELVEEVIKTFEF